MEVLQPVAISSLREGDIFCNTCTLTASAWRLVSVTLEACHTVSAQSIAPVRKGSRGGMEEDFFDLLLYLGVAPAWI